MFAFCYIKNIINIFASLKLPLYKVFLLCFNKLFGLAIIQLPF